MHPAFLNRNGTHDGRGDLGMADIGVIANGLVGIQVIDLTGLKGVNTSRIKSKLVVCFRGYLSPVGTHATIRIIFIAEKSANLPGNARRNGVSNANGFIVVGLTDNEGSAYFVLREH